MARPGTFGRIARMALFVVLVALGAGLVVVHRIEQHLAEPLFDVGREMATYALPEGEPTESPRAIWLNGERAFVATGRSDADLSRVLDHFEARCRRGDVDLAAELSEVSRGGRLEEGPGIASWVDGVLRADNGASGLVACLDGASGASVGQKLRAFDRSGDLADMGDLRYVFARRGSDGTVLTGVWTRGRFRIGRMFPERGDAPGRDVPDVPRPHGARRVLSTWDAELPYRMTLYASSGGRVGDVAADVEASLADRGWSVSRAPRPESTGELAISARREGRSVLVVVSPDPDLDVATVVLEPG